MVSILIHRILNRACAYIFSTCWLLIGVTTIVSAHGYGTHNDELKSILFGQKKFYLSATADKNFYLLCEAVWLTLDMTDQEVGRERLKHLKKLGVKDLPSFEEISFSSNAYHQRYTHFGWAQGYRGVEKKSGAWEKRKKILLSTVEVLGQFKDNEKLKIDAFAALCYEIHILGDHIGDSETTRWTRIRLASEPDYQGQFVNATSDGPFNNPTLFTYMLYHIQRLFREQQNTSEYIKVVQYLKENADRYSDYPVGVGEALPYDLVIEQAKETRDYLMDYLPIMMKREAFFQRAFK